jgi:N4-gp56 family major capsid protein
MADQLFTNDEVLENALISEIVQRELIAQGKLAAFGTNVSQFCVPGAKTIDFPYAPVFTVQKKLPGVALEAKSVTYTSDQLALNEHAAIKWIIEKRAQIQSVVNVEVDAIKKATAAHAKGFDVDFVAQLAAAVAASSNAVSFTGNTNTTMGIADLVDAIVKLENLDVPVDDGNLVLGVNPTQRGELLKLSDFTDASKFGSNMPIAKGQIGMVFNFPVIASTVFTADTTYLWHKEGIYFGFQSGPALQSAPDLDNIGTKYVLDQLYGIKYMQTGAFACKIYQA